MSYIKETKGTIILVIKAWIYACFMNLLLWFLWGYVCMLGWLTILINIGIGCFVGNKLLARNSTRVPLAVDLLVLFITVGCTTLNMINLFAISPILVRSGFDYFILWFFVSK